MQILAAILAADPRHGTPCHAEHAVTAKLVLKALEENVEAKPNVYLKFTNEEKDTYPNLLSFDNSEYSSTLGAELLEIRMEILRWQMKFGSSSKRNRNKLLHTKTYITNS